MQRDILKTAKIGGTEVSQSNNERGGDQNSTHSSHQCQQRTLNKTLHQESLTGGADCSADRHLPAAVAGTCQQEVGNVRTSDQQNACYGSHQQQQKWLSLRNAVRAIGKGAGDYAECAGIEIAVLLHKSVGDALDILPRLRRSKARSQ